MDAANRLTPAPLTNFTVPRDGRCQNGRICGGSTLVF
jgi:hypothetical protein